jgi:hypothetical protein
MVSCGDGVIWVSPRGVTLLMGDLASFREWWISSARRVLSTPVGPLMCLRLNASG